MEHVAASCRHNRARDTCARIPRFPLRQIGFARL